MEHGIIFLEMQPHLELKIAIACYINFTDNSGNINNTYQNFTWTDICKFSALKNSGDTSFDIKFYVIYYTNFTGTFSWSLGLTRTTIDQK